MCLNECFVALQEGRELFVEGSLAFLGFFQSLAEFLIFLPEGDSHSIYGLIAGVFEIPIRDVHVAVEPREFADGDDFMLPFLVWVICCGEIPSLNLFVDVFLRDTQEVGGLCDGEIDFRVHNFASFGIGGCLRFVCQLRTC